MTPELAATIIQNALRLSNPPATYEEVVTLLLADNDAWEKLSFHQLVTENTELKAKLAHLSRLVEELPKYDEVLEPNTTGAMSVSYLEVEATLRGMGFPLWKIESLVQSGLCESVRDRAHLIEGAQLLLDTNPE